MLAAEQLKHTLLVFDAFYDIEALPNRVMMPPQSVLESWAAAEWFLNKPEVPSVYHSHCL